MGQLGISRPIIPNVGRSCQRGVWAGPCSAAQGEEGTDPAARTGRFPIDLPLHCSERKIALFGEEPNQDHYRACLPNMRLCARTRSYFILNGDSRVIDIRLRSPSLRIANLWNPPDLRNWIVCTRGRAPESEEPWIPSEHHGTAAVDEQWSMECEGRGTRSQIACRERVMGEPSTRL